MAQQTSQPKTNPIVIKKYANRRLYNTDTSSYVTLDDLCSMIKQGEEIIVFDAKNGDDITRSVLTQIIVEQESKGQSLLPTGFLRQLIGLYGNNMQGLVPRYLEYAMQSFAKNQTQMQEYFRNAMGGMGGLGGMPPMGSMIGFGAFEEMSKQNMAMFEQAMRMFSPFGGGQAAASEAQTTEQPSENSAEGEVETGEQQETPRAHLRPVPSPAVPEDDASIRQMQQRLDELQKQIASLSKKDEA